MPDLQQLRYFIYQNVGKPADAPSRIWFQAASAAQSPKGSLKKKTRLVFSQAVFC